MEEQKKLEELMDSSRNSGTLLGLHEKETLFSRSPRAMDQLGLPPSRVSRG